VYTLDLLAANDNGLGLRELPDDQEHYTKSSTSVTIYDEHKPVMKAEAIWFFRRIWSGHTTDWDTPLPFLY
jgi:hypothetical protein